MKHLGDITKINGAEVEIVDVITGGSPCQDLSIAGKRAGLAGARSGLFMAQIRIVKEMREHDRANGRTGDMVRPRFMVWENVPGAFSSNKGQDFAAVLEEIIRIAEPEAPDIEVPEKGWPTWGGYHDEVGGRWSVAWRVHDAQYWGVPQRRRRISVVADFGGDTAGEILFERKSVPRHPAESGTARERLAGNAENGAGRTGESIAYAYGETGVGYWQNGVQTLRVEGENRPSRPSNVVICMATQQGGAELRTDDRAPALTAGDRHGVAYISGVDGYNGDLTGDVASTIGVNCGMSTGRNGVMELSANENGGMVRGSVLCAGFKAGQGVQAGGIGYSEEVSPTLASAPSGTNQTPAVVALDMSHACDVIRDCGEVAPSLQARMGTGGNQIPLTYQMQGFGDYREGDVASSCKQRDFKDSTDLVCSVDCRNFTEGGEINGTLQAKESGGQSLNLNNTVRQNMVVRRLTPLECERLQGFPDGWTDIGDWVKTGKRGRKIKVKGSADSPRYKALGNSIALPFWDFLAKRISAQYLRPVTMGSLFDGIGGFPLVFERHNGKGTARWASEIEEFPIAVTKLRFGED